MKRNFESLEFDLDYVDTFKLFKPFSIRHMFEYPFSIWHMFEYSFSSPHMFEYPFSSVICGVCTENVWGASQLLIRHHSQGHLKIPFLKEMLTLKIIATIIQSQCSVKSTVHCSVEGTYLASVTNFFWLVSTKFRMMIDPNLMLMYFACYFPSPLCWYWQKHHC